MRRPTTPLMILGICVGLIALGRSGGRPGLGRRVGARADGRGGRRRLDQPVRREDHVRLGRGEARRRPAGRGHDHHRVRRLRTPGRSRTRRHARRRREVGHGRGGAARDPEHRPARAGPARRRGRGPIAGREAAAPQDALRRPQPRRVHPREPAEGPARDGPDLDPRRGHAPREGRPRRDGAPGDSRRFHAPGRGADPGPALQRRRLLPQPARHVHDGLRGPGLQPVRGGRPGEARRLRHRRDRRPPERCAGSSAATASRSS